MSSNIQPSSPNNSIDQTLPASEHRPSPKVPDKVARAIKEGSTSRPSARAQPAIYPPYRMLLSSPASELARRCLASPSSAVVGTPSSDQSCSSPPPSSPSTHESDYLPIPNDIELRPLQELLRSEVTPFRTILPEEVIQEHEKSKSFFERTLREFNFGKVCYTNAETPPQQLTSETLDPSIFGWSATDGVQHDIPKAAARKGERHLFQLASQYNGSEAPNVYTPEPGKAMTRSQGDNTQGPLAQRTNPRLFELVNALLANRGFNALARVLSPKTMPCLEHGYLMTNSQEQAEALAQEFRTNWQKAEFPCVESRFGDDQSVHLMMAAAPAIGYSSFQNQEAEPMKDLQYLAALAHFTANFKQVICMAKEDPSKIVVYHPCGVGLGYFGNHPIPVANAFRDAALRFQDECKSNGITNRVKVQFEVFRGTDIHTKEFAEHLGLQKKERIDK